MSQEDYCFTELIPGLPEELSLECLTRLDYSVHRVAARVCRRWRSILQSKDFYYHRKKSGHTLKAACLVQALPAPSESKPVGQPSYGISIYDPANSVWDWVDPVPKYPDGLPLFCQVASTEGRLIVMGGWDPTSWEPVKDVFVYDFTTRRWTQCADMHSKMSFFAKAAFEGRVWIAGGHDDSKNALKSAWVYDIEKDDWTELTRMSEERDECEGAIIGSEFWVVSGYNTDSQGRFKSSAEILDLGSGEWRRVENVWGVSQCPRSRVGRGKKGELFCWTEVDPAVRVGACGIDLGEHIFVTGLAYQGAPQGFFLVDWKRGQKSNLVNVNVPDEFSGFVQSGCCVEI